MASEVSWHAPRVEVCVHCGALADKPCVGYQGAPLVWYHSARWKTHVEGLVARLDQIVGPDKVAQARVTPAGVRVLAKLADGDPKPFEDGRTFVAIERLSRLGFVVAEVRGETMFARITDAGKEVAHAYGL